MPHSAEILATVLFAIAVFHTFLVKQFQHLALQYPQGSIGENLFHLLGEVEIVFGLWAGVMICTLAAWLGQETSTHYVESLNFTEPAFVFVIMVIAATRPVVQFAARVITLFAKLIPMQRNCALFASALLVGPLLGSVITEPAAMTVTALILKDRFFNQGLSSKLMYLSLGVLFVNVSIGGVLTNFAAPPVLMVAGKWGWGTAFMATHFGWKAAIAVGLNACLATLIGRRELQGISSERTESRNKVPPWLTVIHLAFLAIVVLYAHHPVLFIGAFLFFLGISSITKEHQEELKLKESLLVGFFLGGLVVLGGLQRWWIAPMITQLTAVPLFVGTTLLTAFTDNAALTYLGAQVPGLSDELKYALVAGAISGGGLTVIANAPNPAGFAILKSNFGEEGINPLYLAAGAVAPTAIAMICLWALP